MSAGKDSASELVGRASWSLTTDRVVKRPAGLDLPALLDQIEAEMKTAPSLKQWSMNHCLAEIGIRNPGLRARDLAARPPLADATGARYVLTLQPGMTPKAAVAGETAEGSPYDAQDAGDFAGCY